MIKVCPNKLMQSANRECNAIMTIATCTNTAGDCSLVRRFYSPKVRKSEIKGSSFRRFVSPKVRKSDNDIDSFLL